MRGEEETGAGGGVLFRVPTPNDDDDRRQQRRGLHAVRPAAIFRQGLPRHVQHTLDPKMVGMQRRAVVVGLRGPAGGVVRERRIMKDAGHHQL